MLQLCVTERDLVPGFLTLIACLAIGVELGIVIGVAVDIAFLLYFNARPGVQVERVQVRDQVTLLLVLIPTLRKETELLKLVQ
jgi:sodium-independent sulfate anion transporter 11